MAVSSAFFAPRASSYASRAWIRGNVAAAWRYLLRAQRPRGARIARLMTSMSVRSCAADQPVAAVYSERVSPAKVSVPLGAITEG